MASDLDKFVLQYAVDLKDSIKKLEELQKKMSGVQETHKKSAAGFRDFVSSASSELGKLAPELDSIGVAARGMGAGFGVATVALAALAVSIKSVIDLKNQYNAQRLIGQEVGVSGMRIEEYNRKFIKYGVPTMDRAQAEAGYKAFSAKTNAAYMTPGGVEWQELQRMGVTPGGLGNPGKGLNRDLQDFAAKLKTMTDNQAEGLAGAVGLSKDWVLSLKQIGPEIANVTEHTEEEIRKRKESEAEIAKLNADLGKFSEQTLRLNQQLGMLVAGPMAKFVGFIADMVEKLNHLDPDDVKDLHAIFFGGDREKDGLMGGKALERFVKRRYNMAKYGRKEGAEPEGSWEPNPESEQKTKDEVVDTMDEATKEQLQIQRDIAASIKAFGASVTTFSAAVSTAQAWAAWAGGVGKAGGLTPQSDNGGMGAPTPTGEGGPAVTFPVNPRGATATGETKYDELIKEAAATYHVDPDLIKRVMSAESKFDPNATSSAGARGLMQIMPSNYKALGLDKDTVTDPRKNIMGGARLLAENLKHFGNEADALRAYNGGWNPKKWGNKETSEYVGRVNSQNVSVYAPGIGPRNQRAGQSKNDLKLAQVQATVAGFLGVDVKELQQGGVNRGDVEFATANIQRGIENSLVNLRKEAAVKGRTPEEHAKLLNDIRDQERGLALMKQYSPAVNANSMEGGQEKTLGQFVFNITVNANGVSPEAITQEVNDAWRKKMSDAVNMAANGQKI